MLLLRGHSSSSAEPEVWTARRAMSADAGSVLQALTDPESIAEWAPVAFEVDGLAGGWLRTGSRARVSGSIAGLGTRFEIDVRQADAERLELVAHGPITFDVAYRFREVDDEVLVEASVGVRRERGLTANILRAAATALLNAGALASALVRLESALPAARDPELIPA